jgi:hypothetical protein
MIKLRLEMCELFWLKLLICFLCFSRFEDAIGENINAEFGLRIGDRVVRGPDWAFGDEDGNSFGVITQVCTVILGLIQNPLPFLIYVSITHPT